MYSIFIQHSETTQTTAPPMSLFAPNFKRNTQRDRAAAARASRSNLINRGRGLQGIRLANELSRSRRARMQAMNEIKGVDTGLASQIETTNMANSVAIQVLNLVQQGTGSWNRVGRKAFLKSVRLTGQVQVTWVAQATITNPGAWIRLLIVWDNQPGGNLPTKGDILGSTNQSGTESSEIYDNVRFDNMSRFKILRDMRHQLDMSALSITNAAGVQKGWNINEYIPLKGLETVFSGQSNPMTIGDISTGALYFICVHDVETTNVTVSTNIKARLRYTD